MKLPVNEIKIGLDFGQGITPVGRLAINQGVLYFEFDESFIASGIEISPFRLPLQTGVVALPARPFEGLAGVFNDSLPDGWGRLLFDRMIRANGLNPATITPLDRLAQVGRFGMGALVYEPDYSPHEALGTMDLDQLAAETEEILLGYSSDVLIELLALNGSSAGARPKAMIGVNADFSQISYGVKQQKSGFESWLIKFPNTFDGIDAGAIEYVYALMAKDAGVSIPLVHLFPAKKGAGYFAVKRFDRLGSDRLGADRQGADRLHMHTASGLLHSDFRTPSLDYEDLLNLTGVLTKDIQEVEKLYRIAVFNVLAHNRDDHGKNFSYLMDHAGEWTFAPAYDLTFSSGPSGEQSTMVMGEGKQPGINHLIKLGQEAKLGAGFIRQAIDQTQDALSQWTTLAKNYGVSAVNIAKISKVLRAR